MIDKSRTRQVSYLRNVDRSSIEPPTPSEVRRMCDKIQGGWTESERSRRLVRKLCPWHMPVIKTADLAPTGD